MIGSPCGHTAGVGVLNRSRTSRTISSTGSACPALIAEWHAAVATANSCRLSSEVVLSALASSSTTARSAASTSVPTSDAGTERTSTLPAPKASTSNPAAAMVSWLASTTPASRGVNSTERGTTSNCREFVRRSFCIRSSATRSAARCWSITRISPSASATMYRAPICPSTLGVPSTVGVSTVVDGMTSRRGLFICTAPVPPTSEPLSPVTAPLSPNTSRPSSRSSTESMNGLSRIRRACAMSAPVGLRNRPAGGV